MQYLPLISVIITSWNNAFHLPQCLDRLKAQTFKDFEIILIDNASQDATLDVFKTHSQNLNSRIEIMDRNLGFAAANNIGARLAQGTWIALLNADAYPEPDWLEQLLHTAEQNPSYNFFSSKQIQYDNPHLLDGAGDEYHISGLAWRRYYNQSVKDHGNIQEEIFGACAAAAMYRREDFLIVGGFDEDHFSYFEDVDLSFRLRLSAGRCLYVPRAIVYHVGSVSTGKLSDFVVYHGHRNLVWTFFKNMPDPYFWLYFPLHLLMNLFFTLSFIFKGKGRAILKAKWDAMKQLPDVLKKRSDIQSQKRIASSEILRLMRRELLAPYWASRQRNLTNGKKQ